MHKQPDNDGSKSSAMGQWPPVKSFLVPTYLCFRLANMLLLEEKLAVQVADINSVQVNLQKSMHKGKVTAFDTLKHDSNEQILNEKLKKY